MRVDNIEKYRDDVLELARECSELTGLSLATIGFKACRNQEIFTHLAKGGTCNVDTFIKIRKWLKDKIALEKRKEKNGRQRA